MAKYDEKTIALKKALEQTIQGDVLFDRTSRILYSTDASNFQIEPIGVVLPRHEDEICAVIELGNQFDIPVIARGSGSSMAGQTLGPGLIIDCSKYLNRIHEINPEASTAVVGPGVILDSLNRRLRADGLLFGPDPASAERATIGGMVGNNATGAHSIRYGLVIDHVLKIEGVLSDGSIVEFEALSNSKFAQAQQRKGLEGAIYARMATIREVYQAAIQKDWPGTWRRASGYSLNYLTSFTPNQPPAWYSADQSYPPTAGMNLAPLIVGSEGTLAVARKITLNLVRAPQAKALAILPYESVAEAADATPTLLAMQPDAIELIPRSIFERARAVPAYARKMGFLVGDPAAVLVVEFSANSPRVAVQRAHSLSGAVVLDQPEMQANLWAVRKVGLGLLMSIPGDTKPITFIEDVAVPVEHLGDFVRRVNRILTEQNTFGEWYAHASAGCLHLRPMVNLKTAMGVNQMREIADAIVELTLQMRGSISGEHGDGLSHTEYNQRLFGPELMQAFRETKDAFDPKGLLNPGKVIPAKDGFGGEGSLTSNLRYGPDYRTFKPETIMAHRREGGVVAAVEACTGVGVCRQERGLMCPSYQATRDEIHTTRGRANALRAALSNVLPVASFADEELHRVLDLCLECKGCKAECPTAVDMARIKAEFLHSYQAEHGVPLRSHLFAHIHHLASLAQPIAGILSTASNRASVRWLQHVFFGVAGQRTLPRLSRETFITWWKLNQQERNTRKHKRVILFVDTYTQFMQPEIGKDAILVLETLGYHVDRVEGQVCCGRPMISKGLLQQARENAAVNIDVLGREAEQGTSIIGLEPSCLLTLRDEYLEFFPEDSRAQALAKQSFLFEEFLLEASPSGERPIDSWKAKSQGPLASIHNHCYTKALVGTEALVQVFDILGSAVEEIESGCCGMAGSFGYEAEHYDLSMQIAEQALLPAVREANSQDRVILAPGYSCRTQIRDGAQVEALHPVQYIASLL